MSDQYRSSSRARRPRNDRHEAGSPARRWSDWDDDPEGEDWDPEGEDWDPEADDDGWEPRAAPRGRSGAYGGGSGRARPSGSRTRDAARDARDDGWSAPRRGGPSRQAGERDRGGYAPRENAPRGGRPIPGRANSGRGGAGGFAGAAERWGETSRQWAAATARRFLTGATGAPARAPYRGGAGGNRTGGKGDRDNLSPEEAKKRRTRRIVSISVLSVILACVLLPALQFGAVYLQARSGLQHFKNAQDDLKKLAAHPFDAATIAATRAEFAGAYSDFSQASDGVGRVGGFAGAPLAGSKVSGAGRLLPIAAEGAQAGMIACDALAIVAPKLKNPFDTSGPGITKDDLAAVSAKFALIRPLVERILAQVQALQPSDLTLDPRVGPLVAGVRAQLPEIKQGLDDVQAVLGVAPALLGVGQPTSYLLEVLDATELRPGGGFIGNDGFITLNAGHLADIHMEDVDLLDKNVKYGTHFIALPSQYAWFSMLFNRWGFRDSNLDADFPTSAKNGEQLYKLEAGSAAVPVQGVVAITPWLIRDALKITGPITMAEYNDDKITADNLIEKIHYYQLTNGVPPGSDKTYDPVSGSSLRKRFSGLLFKYFMAKIKDISAQDMSGLVKLIMDGLHSKDIQLYLNSDVAQVALQHRHLAATLDAPATGDSFFAVDANIAANKSNYVIASAISDQVTIDDKGTAVHKTTLTYTWPNDPKTLTQTYPSDLSRPDVYHGYERLYIPPTAKIDGRNGWGNQSAGSAFNRQVLGGDYRVYYKGTTTLTLNWTSPGAATHDATGWHYKYLLQKQAGAVYNIDLKIALPACAKPGPLPSGFVAADAHTIALKPQPFATDINLALDYAC